MPYQVVIGVPAIHLATCKANFKPEIAVSSEDVSARSGYGAFTGEMTAQMLMDSGITWAIVGHSERRDGFDAPVILPN